MRAMAHIFGDGCHSREKDGGYGGPMKREKSAPAANVPLVLIQDWDDGDEVLDNDIAALKELLAQRDAQATEFRRVKDRLLGRR